ncbi:hypothetical protein [Arcicella rigui]|uniref:DUF304 domain-containing protein n=1 Tax=Arcicella rigui TaxID=797020 RepID=A0ABU5QAW7_9BACT|nr:hypothetical protein [Arcicella rigui]MEA5139998.1 hypothetical protein [Arcicella rigui]
METNFPITFKVNIIKDWELVVGLVFILFWFVSAFFIFHIPWFVVIPLLVILFWQLNLVFAEIKLTHEGIEYKSWIREVVIKWNEVNTLGGIARIKRQYFEVISIQSLKADIKYKSQVGSSVYVGEVKKLLFISNKEQFNPNRFTWISDEFISFEYRPEILKIIQEKLEAIDKNV